MEHLKADLGRLKRGSTVVVTLDKQANVLLMDASNYRTYSQARGGNFRYFGGLIKRSPARIAVPSDGHWFVAIDLGGAGGRIRHSISVVPPPRGNLPEYRQPSGPAVADEISTRRPVAPQSDDDLDGRTWDVFLSHASEDKAAVANPLAQALQDRGVTVWLDRAELRIGDSLRRRINAGLRSSRFAAVIFSEAYFAKGWPQYELDGIVTLTVDGRQKFARSTSATPIDDIAAEIAALVLEARDEQ